MGNCTWISWQCLPGVPKLRTTNFQPTRGIVPILIKKIYIELKYPNIMMGFDFLFMRKSTKWKWNHENVFLMLCFESILKKINFFLFFNFKLIFFFIFLDYFDALLSKIIFKK